MQKLNKYEKRIMLNLKIITFICIAGVIVNIFVPLVESFKMTMFVISQLVPIFIIYVKGWFNSRGSQNVPILAAFLIRVLQVLIFILWLEQVSLLMFGVLLVFDVVLLLALIIDKMNYRYEYVNKSDIDLM